MDRVVELLIKQAGDSDSQLPKRLGISRVMWMYLKSGQRRPGMKFYGAVMREFPELIPDILLAIREKQAKEGNHDQ